MRKFLLIISFIFFLPNISQAEKIIDLTNSEWKDNDAIATVGIFSGKIKYKYRFSANGFCENSHFDLVVITERDCVWTQDGNLVKITLRKGASNEYCFIAKIDGRKLTRRAATCSNFMAYGNAKKRTSIATRYTSFLNEKKSVVQKKEKSSPKIFVDDSKIIAASSGSGFFCYTTGSCNN